MNDVEWSDLVSTWQQATPSDAERTTPTRAPSVHARARQALSISHATPTQGFVHALLQRVRRVDEWLALAQTALGTIGMCGVGLQLGARFGTHETLPHPAMGAGIAALLLAAATRARQRVRALRTNAEEQLASALAPTDEAPEAQGSDDGAGAAHDDAFADHLVVRPRREGAAQIAVAIWLAGCATAVATLLWGGSAPAAMYTLGMSVATGLLGAGLLSGIVHNNWFAVGARQEVRADARGVRVNGRLVAPSGQEVFGYVKRAQWGLPFGARAWCVTLYRLRRQVPAVVFEAEVTSIDQGTAVLRALHLSEDRNRLDLVARSPWTNVAAVITVSQCALFVPLILRVVTTPAGARSPALVAAPFVVMALGVLSGLAAVLPSRLSIGSDGVSLRWLGWRRFLSFAEVEHVQAKGTSLNLGCRGARPWVVRFGDAEVCEAACARIQAATLSLALTRTRSVALPVDPTHAASLSSGESAYRIAAVTDDVLAARLRDANLPREQRVAAAKALVQRAPEMARALLAAELRVSADPELRAEFEALLGPQD
jgi:hypothetical protein